MKTTEWFDVGSDPTRPGLYEVAFFDNGKEKARAIVQWHGNRWSVKNSMQPLAKFGDKWRGLPKDSQT